MPSTAQIDAAILQATDEGWKKVAMVVLVAADQLPDGLPEGDAGYQIIADRIGVLVREGRLAAQGDITKWRHSEVKWT